MAAKSVIGMVDAIQAKIDDESCTVFETISFMNPDDCGCTPITNNCFEEENTRVAF